MILNFLLFILHGFLSFIVTHLLPAGTPVANPAITGAVIQASGLLSSLGDFVPNGALLAATLVLLGFEAVYGAYKVIKWGYTKIPGIS